MNKKYFSFLAVVSVMSLLILSSFASATFGSLGIGYTLLDGRLKPGQSSSVSLVFSNAASGAAYNIKVYITPGIYVVPEKNYFELGSIGPGSSQSTTLNFNIDGSAVSGNSFITLDVKYNLDGTSGEQESVVTIPITIYREPILQLSNVAFNVLENLTDFRDAENRRFSSTTRIKPDDTILMSFNIANVGAGGAKDVRISLQNSSAFTYVGSNELYSASIPPSGSQSFSFIIRVGSNANPGIYSIPLQLSYNFEDGKQNKTESKLAQMEIFGKANLGISNIKTDPASLTQGDFASLIVKVENTGTGDAKSVRVSIDSPFLKNQVSLGKIAADEDASAVFAFGANNAGDLPYTLTVDYTDDFGKNSINDTEKLTVYGKSADGTIYIVAIAAVLIIGYLAYARKAKLFGMSKS